MERNLDFDVVVDRKNTNCLKYDFAVQRGMPADVLPLWVADMDFQTSSYIQDAIDKQVQHGVFGYTESDGAYFEALKSWMQQRHNWTIQESWLVKTPGVVFALAMAVKAFTKQGESILIQRPVYYPFGEVIQNNGRNVIDSTLQCDESGKYTMNLKDFEEKIINENVKMFFLCNPHNPVGRVWTKEELIGIGDICYRHKVMIVSDEIHADFAFARQHEVFVNLKPEYANITITCTAPSKTFNIAGLQISNILIANTELKQKFQSEMLAAGYNQVNAVGMKACQAAYQHGEEWYQTMTAYVKENIAYLKEYLQNNIPQIKMREPEGTYLVWIDCRGLQLSKEALEELIVHKAKLWLDSGDMFGSAGEGFQRINVACPRVTLAKALSQLKAALDS